MSSKVITLAGDLQRTRAKMLIDHAPVGAVVTISEKAEARTSAQNRLLHRWFGDISRDEAFGDTAQEIKAQCNLTYGLPILSRDDAEWHSAFSYLFSDLNHAAKLKAIRVLDVPFTRRMGVRQLSEYMDAMQRDYLQMGVRLTDPEMRGMEAMA